MYDDTFNLDPFYGHRNVQRDASRVAVDRCNHDWSSLELIPGRTEVPAFEDEPAYALEYGNCRCCHTTLCREVAP